MKKFNTTSCNDNTNVDNETCPSIIAECMYMHDSTMNCDAIDRSDSYDIILYLAHMIGWLLSWPI